MKIEDLQKQIVEAMKAHDEVRLSTLRMLLSELRNEKIRFQHDLSDEEGLSVVRKEVKKRKDSIEAYGKAGRVELVEREKSELEILTAFLPTELSDDELRIMIEEAIRELNAKTAGDAGKVIGVVVAKAHGRADGSKISSLVREHLK